MSRPEWLKRRWWVIPILAILLAAVAFAAWAGSPAAPMPEALAALAPDRAVAVDTSRWLAFAPASTPVAGMVFYPGGLVDPQAYAPMARALAQAGFLTVLVPMPLNLAVLDVDAAADVLAAYPEVERWVVGGHSLGGAMAARYAADHPEAADGLLLLAAYPDQDLSARALAVTSVYGTLDGLATVEQVEASAPLLPASTRFVRVDGGNHAYFGWYGDQARDNPATITREAQQRQVVDAALDLLRRVAAGAASSDG